MMADTQGSIGLTGTAAYGGADGGLLVSGSRFDSGDLFEGVDLRRGQALGRVTQRLGDVALRGLALHGRSERTACPEDSGGPRLAVVRERERRDARLTVVSLEASRATQAAVQPRLTLNWSRQRSDANTPPIAPGVLPGVPRIIADSRFEDRKSTRLNSSH